MRRPAYEPVEFLSAEVVESEYFSPFDHNVVWIRGKAMPGGDFEADFLGFFESTGGMERWGGPISEAFEEEPGVLAQYFENGVLEYRPGLGVEPRPVWELIGGGAVEGRPLDRNRGKIVGLWNRKISNVSVEGLHGVSGHIRAPRGEASFGDPMSDARGDVHQEAELAMSKSLVGVFRQYFQAAVLQVYRGLDQSPTILPLGREVQELLYPDGGWRGLAVFSRTEPLEPGTVYPAAYLGRLARERREASAGPGALVGTGIHPYAIAYHPQRHLLYRDGDGWYAFFFDGEYGVLTYSRDGIEFTSPQVVTHVPAEKGVSMYEVGGELYLLYADSNGIRVFVRRAEVSRGRVRMAEPIRVMGADVSFSRELPNMAFDPEGRPWVVARSYQSTPEGATVNIWVSQATDVSMREWTRPVRITSDDEASRGWAGTSGSLAFVDRDVLIVFAARDEMAGYVGDYRAVEELAGEIVGGFLGMHDFILISDGKRAHLAYHRPAAGGEMMTYRYWTRDGGWSEWMDVGVTATHATAMTVDEEGNIWVFYGIGPEINFRVLKKGESAGGRGGGDSPELELHRRPGDLKQAGVWPHAGEVAAFDSVALHEPLELAGTDELFEGVEIRRQRAGGRPVLEQLDDDEPAQFGAIDGLVEVDAAGLEYAGGGGDGAVQVMQMLEGVDAKDDIEVAVREGKVLGGRYQIVDGEACGRGVLARDVDGWL
jgi:hypothetical protein